MHDYGEADPEIVICKRIEYVTCASCSHIHSIMAKAGAVMNPENLYKDSAKHKAVRKLDKLYNKIGNK